MNEYNVYASGPRKGKPKTLTDRVVRFLVEKLKATEIPSKNRYRKFTKYPLEIENYGKYGVEGFYWVGKNAAVRAGKNISDSVSLTSYMRCKMKIWEKEEE